MGTKKRGRPPKQQRQQLREEYMEVRVTAAEKQAFKDAAELSGLPLSAWLRDRMRRIARQELQESGRKVAFLEETGGSNE